MSALGSYLEGAGRPTVSISLVREHTERMRPPRALWVPFALGRPFGPPDRAALQRRVVAAALALLEAPEGPVLVDFPEEEPAEREVETPWVCPVRFDPPLEARDSDDHLLDAVLSELRELAPWYELSRSTRHRSAVGLSRSTLEDCARQIAAYRSAPSLDAEPAPAALVDKLRWAADDLKAYYVESATAQPGHAGQVEIETWFWRETRAAALLGNLRSACLQSARQATRELGEFMLVPREYA